MDDYLDGMQVDPEPTTPSQPYAVIDGSGWLVAEYETLGEAMKHQFKESDGAYVLQGQKMMSAPDYRPEPGEGATT